MKTHEDIPDMTGDRLKALHYNSLHGYAGAGYAGSQARLNYDEFVVYEEEAILPFALVDVRVPQEVKLDRCMK